MTDALLSLRAAARVCGFGGHPRAAARRLMRYLAALELRVGVPLLVASGDGGGRRYMVSAAGLREACPALVTRRDEIVEAVRAAMASLEERLETLEDRQDLIADVVAELSRRGPARSREVPSSAHG